MHGAALTLVMGVTALAPAAAMAANDPPAWTEPTEPFAITSDIFYVGSKGLAAYLIRSSAGLILLDGTMAENVPAIERNIATLDFRMQDIRILLNSHAHFDHAAGLAQLKKDSGARMLASAGDRWALEAGKPRGLTSYGVVTFPAVKVDGVVRDGQPVRLGNVALTPVLTPGHTPGCTTWTMRITERGKPLAVVFPCSLTVAGNLLTGNSEYPGIVADFRRSFARMKTLKADIVLPAHPEAGDVFGRRARRDAGNADAFMDPGLLARIVGDSERVFEAEVAKAAPR